MATAPSVEFLRLPRLIERVGFSKSEIYRRIRAGSFPQGERLSHKVGLFKLS
mgnify:CR=1 FL=1